MNFKENKLYKRTRKLYYFIKNFPINYPKYRNTYKLRFYHNKYKGQVCFVIGNGPSLRISDLEKIQSKGYKTFCSNRIYKAFSKTTWRPDFYFLSDKNLIDNMEENLKEIPAKRRFFPYRIKDVAAKGMLYNELEFDWNTQSKFSKDAGKGVYPPGTITVEMMQFAYYMGFSEIYLLGVDFSYEAKQLVTKNSYAYNGENNYFIEGYMKPGEISVLPNVVANLNGFNAARRVIEADGRIVKNATRGGKLEAFERVDVDELLGGN